MSGFSKIALLPAILLTLGSGGCTSSTARTTLADSAIGGSVGQTLLQSQPMLPGGNRVMLMLGQDLDSISAYVRAGLYPTPAGVTTYLAFYKLLSSTFPAYGALGQDTSGNATEEYVDWGAGPLNAQVAASRYPDSALVIGLSIAEGDQENVWAKGGLAAIGVGLYDDRIERLARFCRDLQRPVYLRVGYEFDGAWNRGYANYRNYVLAYRHIVDVMRQQGVNNVDYVWQASASPIDDVIDGYHEDIRQWYPGDEYVDWLGISWFLPPDERLKEVPTQRELADEVLELAKELGKPVMIAEAAPQGYDLEEMTVSNLSGLWNGPPGSDKQQLTAKQVWLEWFAPLFQYIRRNSDTIRAFSYINADWEAQALWSSPHQNGYWGDSRIQVNPQISARWLSEVNDTSFWLHGGPRLQKQLSD